MSDSWETPQTDFVLDGSGYGASTLNSGGTVDKDGWYHLEIEDVKLELDVRTKKPADTPKKK